MLLELFLRRRVAREQPLARDRDTTRASFSCASARSRSAVEPIDFRLERPRIDLIQEVACRYAPAFREVHGLDVAADARPDLDAFDGFETAREVGPIVEIANGHFGRRDFRRWRSRWGITRFADGASRRARAAGRGTTKTLNPVRTSYENPSQSIGCSCCD